MSPRILDPKEWQFEFQQRGNHPVLAADFWCRAVKFNHPKEINLDITGLDYLMTSENKGYYKKDQREAVMEKFKDRLNNDTSYFHYILDTTQKRFSEFKEFMDSHPDDWHAFTEKVLNTVPWFYIPWYLTEYNFISDRVVTGLEKYKGQLGNITDINNAAMVIMFPKEQMGFQEEQEEFYKLVGEIKSGKDVNYKDYLERFGWMKTFILNPTEPMSEAELMKKIEQAITDKSDETYKLQYERKDRDKKLVAQIESIIQSDGSLLKDIEDARKLAWLLTWSVECGMKAFASGIPWYKEIAKRIGLKYEDWVYLTIDEVRDSLEKRLPIVDKEEIESRKKAHVLGIADEGSFLLTGGEASSIIDSLNNRSSSDEKVEEIVGKPASPGVVIGKVTVCPSASDSHTVEEGDILVCSMTTPDYVPAMKKAGAIVTDEGGLLCHAAIISRELGKPCVIATRIATKILKTGDKVEVDANRGIVRIIQNEK